MAFISGKKLKMSVVFDKDGNALPVTLIETATDALKEGEFVKINGVSKGKGFQGVVKRWGFHGGPRTHGQKHSEREPGSIGSKRIGPVAKGKKMAGRTGGKRVTLKNLRIIMVDKEKNVMAVKGAIPGNRGSRLKISF